MIAGMDEWTEAEGTILKELRPRHMPSEEITDDSGPILDWIAAEGITTLAVHFDLDVLDPAHFSPLLFNKPGVPDDTFEGTAQGAMQLEQVGRLLKDVGAATDMVGLAITEHMP